MKKILGLDLGTNSIGWALVNHDESIETGSIVSAGSRIIPMSQEILGEFEKGNSISQTAERTSFRSIRRLRERNLLRRERLHRVLNILGFLPKHYSSKIDFNKRPGQFIENAEPKIAYDENGRFIFKKSFDEMLADFSISQPQLLINKNGNPAQIPYDWTIYYLRKKALTQSIEKEELAWILLHFNKKRGYYQLRGEDEDSNPGKLVEFYELKVVNVEATGDLTKSEIWYDIILENGWVYRRSSKIALFDWVDKRKEFIVTTDINDDGSIKTDKEGKEKRSFKSVDSEKDWIAIKKSTENKIENSQLTVGCYIYDTLLQNPTQKIKGKLVRTIERKFYKAELHAILSRQIKDNLDLQSSNLYMSCLEELYGHNDAHKNNLGHKDFIHLFINDIIFYQRPLKSKKSLVSNCRYESRSYKNDNGTIGNEPIKCIAASHPLFQEFRLWQWLRNLKIYLQEDDCDVTSNFLSSEEEWVNLFDWLKTRKEIDQKAFLKYPAFNLKKDIDNYRWNFVADKTYPCNETYAQIQARLIKVPDVPIDFLTSEIEEALWHILYSVEDKIEIEKALTSFASKHGLNQEFITLFKKYPRIEKEYGSYSSKAIKKLLPLMRMGKYWNEENIHPQSKERIDKILTGEFDEKIKTKVREKVIQLTGINDFSGLPLWLACYVVYDRYSEEGEINKWHTAKDIQLLKQHSLRNPIVEQVINETMQVVRDIWNVYGEGKENFFDEIHIELGRDMKNPASIRKEISNRNTENENTNLRIKSLLIEMLNDSTVENVRPYSPSQQEILKIFEDGVLSSTDNIPEEILKISKTSQPSKSELNRYRLWLDQKYRSPYTGAMIPLNRLFTTDYEIEHIIPQSRFFDDSFSNKVICEAEVNKLKDNQLGLEFIKNHHGEKVTLAFGKTAEVFSEDEYLNFVKSNYASPSSRGKRNKLLLEDIPDKMIERQLNDARYISKIVKNLLSNIVRAVNEQETTSKNVISCNGAITSILKQDWGLNDIWNEIISPRFIRLNELTKSSNFGSINPNTNKFLPQVPFELQKGFNKKRIDHRHHALDAIVIACASRNHINYLNNEYAKSDKKDIRFELRNKLRRLEVTEIVNHKTGARKKIQVAKEFLKPWSNFTEDAKSTLLSTLVSFKQNLRVINKTTNHYQKWVLQNDNTFKKEFIKQTIGDSWAIRKSMHKDTISGLVHLCKKKTCSFSYALDSIDMIVDKDLRKKVKELLSQGFDKKKILKYFKEKNNIWLENDISKIETYYWENENVASRVRLDDSFNSKKIESVTDTGIQRILFNHLQLFNEEKNGEIIEHPELAFSSEGLDTLNADLAKLNRGKQHKAIIRVRTYEPKGNKFNVGTSGNKINKYAEAAKGTNLFFAIYADEHSKRSYETIPLNIVIERQKQGLLSVPENNEKGETLLFFLSPNDLVYIPSEDEKCNPLDLGSLNRELGKIYKVVSFTGNNLFLVRNDIAFPIVNKVEFSALNKTEKSIDGIMIKEYCWKLKVDRIGKIIGVIR